jgi:hypothetical protein
VDACHLKGHLSDQLMCAIGKDGNDDMFPIAYAVVEAETKDSWSWFLSILIEDIGSIDERAWTFMSDLQKVRYPKKIISLVMFFFFSCLDYVLLIKCALMCFCLCKALLKHSTTYCEEWNIDFVYDIYTLTSREKGGKERPLKMNCGVQPGQVRAGNLSTI